MFGHRGLWQDGWKAVAYHPPGQPFDKDKWELFHLDRDFSETDNRAEQDPGRLKAMIETWWRLARAHQVLPLDDRFGPRFAENAQRYHGMRKRFVFHAGMGHLPTDVAPDVRSRSYTMEADVRVDGPETRGVLIAHGDATSGYSLYVRDNRLVHDLNIGGTHVLAVSDRTISAGNRKLGIRMRMVKGARVGTLLIDGAEAGHFESKFGFNTLISWSGLDIGLDRGSPVSDYEAPFAFTGLLRKVTVIMDDDQRLDGESAGRAEMARQ
jgi:arylsulfatase